MFSCRAVCDGLAPGTSGTSAHLHTYARADMIMRLPYACICVADVGLFRPRFSSTQCVSSRCGKSGGPTTKSPATVGRAVRNAMDLGAAHAWASFRDVRPGLFFACSAAWVKGGRGGEKGERGLCCWISCVHASLPSGLECALAGAALEHIVWLRVPEQEKNKYVKWLPLEQKLAESEDAGDNAA